MAGFIMATTTNYGWTTPDNTAYVKDGSSAIRSLGSAIDTTSATTNLAGLVLIRSTTVGAVSDVQVNTIFSSTYDNYVVVLSNFKFSTGAGLSMRIGTSANNTNYRWSRVSAVYGNTTVVVDGSNSTSSFSTGLTSDTVDVASGTLTIYRPFLTTATGITGQGVDSRTGGGSGSVTGVNANSTSYTGLYFVPTGGTITSGQIDVYGIRKAI
jgi:hypothetical protein